MKKKNWSQKKKIVRPVGEEMPETVISVDHVTMRYRIAEEDSSSLKEYLINKVTKKSAYKELLAVNDVSFEVGKGEILGIIGVNGSGKSTLLKLIAGVIQPSGGTIVVDRKKVQLLTLGSGFDMELSAKENVYLSGSIIGYSREYIDKKYDEIVEFAELGGFMQEKMKKFSSGMISRLAFAIATARETPEILILDEVLSVGDLFFKQKSEEKMREMIKGGSTVLIVSHSPEVIRKNCTKAIWIHKGELRMEGNPEEVCSCYQNMGRV